MDRAKRRRGREGGRERERDKDREIKTVTNPKSSVFFSWQEGLSVQSSL